MGQGSEPHITSPFLTDSVEGSLLSLLDERACANVVQRYGTLADGDDVHGFVDLFTPDAVWQRAEGTVYKGHEQIRSVYRSRPRQGMSYHLICNVTICLFGDEAMAHSSAVVLKSPLVSRTSVPAVAIANYLDNLARCSDGRWRIARRSSTFLLKLPSD